MMNNMFYLRLSLMIIVRMLWWRWWWRWWWFWWWPWFHMGFGFLKPLAYMFY